MIKISMMAMLHKRGGLTGRAQRVGFFFNIWQVRVGIEKLSNRFRSGRSAEIFYGVFTGTLFTLGYIRVSWVFRVYPMIRFN